MTDNATKRGRKSAYQRYDELYRSCPKEMRRPKYYDRIGVRRGEKGDNIFLKIQLPYGGTWEGKTYPPGHAAEIKLGKISSFTWEKAKARRDELQRRADNNLPLEDTALKTFSEWADDWLKRKEGQIRRPDTAKLHLKKHLKPTFGNKTLVSIKPSDIERWIADMKKAKLTEGYLKRMIATMKSILNDAKREGLIDINPATLIGKLKGQARQRFLETEEILTLLGKAQQCEEWLYNMIVWALHSGMRRGEILALNWSDIRTLDDGTKIALINDSKSGKSRMVTCTPDMVNVLESQRKKKQEGDDRVWPISLMTLRRRWDKVREDAQLPDIDFHDIRRTNITIAASANVDIRTLAGRAGHSDLAMLERHYAVLRNTSERDAAKKIQRTFASMKPKVVSIRKQS